MEMNMQIFVSESFVISSFAVTTKVAWLETTKTRSHKGTKKRKSFEILGVLSVLVPLW
jgi:hypothetical protein